MSTRATHPVSQAILGWMQLNTPRLRELLAEEVIGDEDPSPVSDGSIRAHLRFVGEAFSENASAANSALAGFADGALRARLEMDEDEFAEHVRATGEAHAFEAVKQFGEEAGADPSNRAVLDRRVRVGAWIQVFLSALDEAREPDEPVAPAINEWMHERQAHLANTIFAMDRRAKEAEIARGNEIAVNDPQMVNQIGQATMLQAHMRFLVEALAEAL